MSVFKNGRFYHFEFKVDGRRRRGSTGTANKQQAIVEERRQRERLEKSYSQVIEEEAREQRRKTIKFAADEFLVDYRAKHQSPKYAEYALGHVSRLLGRSLGFVSSPALARLVTLPYRRAGMLVVVPLMLLFTAGQPQAPPVIAAALSQIEHHIDERLAQARLPSAV